VGIFPETQVSPFAPGGQIPRKPLFVMVGEGCEGTNPTKDSPRPARLVPVRTNDTSRSQFCGLPYGDGFSLIFNGPPLISTRDNAAL
jgi:hypothetical protein